jgi:hypothetical protein
MYMPSMTKNSKKLQYILIAKAKLPEKTWKI